MKNLLKQLSWILNQISKKQLINHIESTRRLNKKNLEKTLTSLKFGSKWKYENLRADPRIPKFVK
jgi:hypothetical protein